jgi:hypothetical protein
MPVLHFTWEHFGTLHFYCAKHKEFKMNAKNLPSKRTYCSPTYLVGSTWLYPACLALQDASLKPSERLPNTKCTNKLLSVWLSVDFEKSPQ